MKDFKNLVSETFETERGKGFSCHEFDFGDVIVEAICDDVDDVGGVEFVFAF